MFFIRYWIEYTFISRTLKQTSVSTLSLPHCSEIVYNYCPVVSHCKKKLCIFIVALFPSHTLQEIILHFIPMRVHNRVLSKNYHQAFWLRKHWNKHTHTFVKPQPSKMQILWYFADFMLSWIWDILLCNNYTISFCKFIIMLEILGIFMLSEFFWQVAYLQLMYISYSCTIIKYVEKVVLELQKTRKA